jgi:hypothetical protein
MNTETVEMTTAEFAATQVVVVGWMQQVMDEAGENGRVRVTRTSTFAGRFVVGMEVAA